MRPKFEYRITKYNPAKRNENGHYVNPDEWTDISDIKKGIVSPEEYERVEDAYINAASAIMIDNDIASLQIHDVENYDELPVPSSIEVSRLADVLKPVLRGDYWARLTSGKCFIHIGWDFYMYVGADHISEATLREISEGGLFPETMLSPYFPEED